MFAVEKYLYKQFVEQINVGDKLPMRSHTYDDRILLEQRKLRCKHVASLMIISLYEELWELDLVLYGYI
jgi:hypothetical protein